MSTQLHLSYISAIFCMRRMSHALRIHLLPRMIHGKEDRQVWLSRVVVRLLKGLWSPTTCSMTFLCNMGQKTGHWTTLIRTVFNWIQVHSSSPYIYLFIQTAMAGSLRVVCGKAMIPVSFISSHDKRILCKSQLCFIVSMMSKMVDNQQIV